MNMKKEDGVYFIPIIWLGDWQQSLKGHLLDDENLNKRLLGNPEQSDWENRIKPQIFSAWKKKVIKDGNIERQYWYQPGIIKTVSEAASPDAAPVKKTRKKKADLIEVENPEFEGFNLDSLLKIKPTVTILYQPATTEDKQNIWSMGVKLLQANGVPEVKARGFIAKLIKEYSDKEVAAALAQLSLKQVSPAEVNSYLIGILKKQQEGGFTKKTGRGSVSL
jgi:hypothetical protein